MRDFSTDHRWLSINTATLRKSRGQDIRAACGQLIVEGGVKKSAAQQMALLLES